ncbi:MAG: hypothetical protein JSV15_00970 [Candidatus Bathyarchaeota archaeon]|nr:MAG: hypothetical protein JSV15_00970 [Candidatus Bathyarchaeota archaeon]
MQTVNGAEVRELEESEWLLLIGIYPISDNIGANLFTAFSGKSLAEKT